MPKVKAKQTRALDILKKDTGILESPTPSRVYSPTVCQNQFTIYGFGMFPVRSVCVRGIRDMNSDGFWKPVDDIFQILFRK